MANSRLKINVKNILFDIVKILLIVCVVFGSTKVIPAFFKNENITKETIPVSVNNKLQTGEKGSIELLMTGNSCLYSSFNPLQLWNEWGITSYVAGSPKQNMSVSYYILKEILTVQSPKVIMLEVNNFFETRGVDDAKENLKIAYTNCFPIFKYTKRWDEMIDNQYVQAGAKNQRLSTRGYFYSDLVKPYYLGMSYMKATTKREPLAPYGQKYLSKIMSLAQKNNVQVLFVNFPSQTAWTYSKHNTIIDLAKEYNVPYIDYNVGDTTSGFDWKTDSRDGGNHLNYSGAKKMTKVLGQYLHQNFKFKDYRGNPNFTDWNEEYTALMKKINK